MTEEPQHLHNREISDLIFGTKHGSKLSLAEYKAHKAEHAFDELTRETERLGLYDAPPFVTVTNGKITLDVALHDEPERMTWHEAMAKFKEDKEWRLPTIDELHLMYENKHLIPNLRLDSWYWSSTEYTYDSLSWLERFSDGYQYYYGKNVAFQVRCVRR